MKAKFKVGQIVMWRRRHQYDDPYPTQITGIETRLGYPTYHVKNAHAPSGWEESRFRSLNKRERGA